jgi:hypothetical protein
MRGSAIISGRLEKASCGPGTALERRAEKQAAKNAVKWPKKSQGIPECQEKTQVVFSRGFAGVSAIFEAEHRQGKIETGVFSINSGVMPKNPVSCGVDPQWPQICERRDPQ